MSSEMIPVEKTQESNGPSFQVTVEVSIDAVTNAIVGALEGGYSPWLHTFMPAPTHEALAAKSRGGEHTVWHNDPGFWQSGGQAISEHDDPLKEEGVGDASKVVGMAELIAGLHSMAKADPRHFADLVNENDDAETHDVFMQHVILGEVVYG